jgi:FRG domain
MESTKLKYLSKPAPTDPAFVSDIHVSAWPELQSKLYEGSWQSDLKRFRSPFAFRGLADARSIPETTLIRLGGQYQSREQSLLRNFRKYAHRNTAVSDSVWNWIALAQHHGLPTRLLDWSFSPYVALHFATVRRDLWRHAAAIWCVNCVKVKEYLPRKLRQLLKEEDSDVLTAEMLDRGAPTLTAFERLSRTPFVAFFEPPSLDDRIVNQAALFSVTSRANLSLFKWLGQHPDLFHRILIPAELKQEIRDKLDQANINERILFPGLDGLSQWLTRYYSPIENRESRSQHSRYSGGDGRQTSVQYCLEALKSSGPTTLSLKQKAKIRNPSRAGLMGDPAKPRIQR